MHDDYELRMGWQERTGSVGGVRAGKGGAESVADDAESAAAVKRHLMHDERLRQPRAPGGSRSRHQSQLLLQAATPVLSFFKFFAYLDSARDAKAFISS